MNHSVKIFSKDTNEVVFTILTDNDNPVYMRCIRSYAMNTERAIVILDSKKFLSNWKNDPNPVAPELSKGTRDTWINDRKYPDAALGFKQGVNNPVPLAKIVFHESLHSSYINFTDGITRTIWLLSNGVTAFPVECSTQEAEKLSLAAGFNPGEYLIVTDLLQG